MGKRGMFHSPPSKDQNINIYSKDQNIEGILHPENAPKWLVYA